MASPPSSPSAATAPTMSSSRVVTVDADSIAAAALRRMQEQSSSTSKTTAQLAKEHEARQEFRRLIDPGIMRPNSRDKAMESLKVLKTLGENIIREPTNPKFLQFKPTNNTIKRVLMERPGALEYAIRVSISSKVALNCGSWNKVNNEEGFVTKNIALAVWSVVGVHRKGYVRPCPPWEPEVQGFQPFYTFNPRKMEDLRMGVAILGEVIDLDTQTQQRIEEGRRQEKATRAAAKEQVKLAFIDDRKSVERRVEGEKVIRSSVAAADASTPSIPERRPRKMPGQGQTLSGEGVVSPHQGTEESASDEEED